MIVKKYIFIVEIETDVGDSGGPLWFEGDGLTDPTIVAVTFAVRKTLEYHEEQFTTVNEEILEFIHTVINM